MLGLGGVTWIDTRVAGVTLSVAAGETTGPEEAVMLLEPTPRAVPKPLEPAALLTVATAALDDDHVTTDVRSCMELSVYVPVAVTCWFTYSALFRSGGVTWIDTRVAAVTLSVEAGETTRPDDAVMLLDPTPSAVPKPFEPAALLTVATAALD